MPFRFYPRFLEKYWLGFNRPQSTKYTKGSSISHACRTKGFTDILIWTARRLKRWESHRLALFLALYPCLLRFWRLKIKQWRRSSFGTDGVETPTDVKVLTIDDGSKDSMDVHWSDEVSPALTTLILWWLIPRRSERLSWSLVIWVRAADILLRRKLCKYPKSKTLERICNYGDVALFCMACSEIMFSWFYCPASLPKAYVTWIGRMADLDPVFLQMLRLFRTGNIVYGQITGNEHLVDLSPYCQRHGIKIEEADWTKGFLACSILHPGFSCFGNSVDRFRKGFLKAMGIYAPLYTVAILLSYARQSNKHDRSASAINKAKSFPSLWQADNGTDSGISMTDRLLVAAQSSFRSSTFLGLFISIIWSNICLVRQIRYNDGPLGPWLGSSMAGLAILVERKARRAELLLYVIPRALWSLGYRLGACQNPTWLQEALAAFSASWSMGVLVATYYQAPKQLRLSSKAILSLILPKQDLQE